MPPRKRLRLSPRLRSLARRGPGSLSGRLLIGSALFTTLALLLALLAMHHVLSRFVTGQIDQRLDNKLVALASQVVATSDGAIRVIGNADGPPFDKPHHLSFWWVQGPKNDVHTGWLRIGDYAPPSVETLATLPAPPRLPGPPPGADEGSTATLEIERPRTIDGIGPHGTPMHVRAGRRTIDGIPVTILVAAPDVAITGPMREAMTTVTLALAIIGAALLVAALAQVRVGLRPLAKLRREIEAVRAGETASLSEAQPHEVRPLVIELNALLAQNAETLVRARGHVANLAHGLKTPLATLALSLDRLRSDDRVGLQTLVRDIEGRIRHHLGRARVAALAGPARVRTPLVERLRDVVGALEKINADKRVIVTLECPIGLAVACELQDVDEMVGNLLENAFRYAKRHVMCSAIAEIGSVRIIISDDGPGLPSDKVREAMIPGQRLDEVHAGHGFGLPIARELAELYGGSLHLSNKNGLFVELKLPRA